MDGFGMSANIAIREMLESDPPIIASAFSAQGWKKPLSHYLRYWQESTQGRRLILLAEHAGEFAGYLTILWESDYPPFRTAAFRRPSILMC
jgi:hypothetical protein